MSSLTKCILQSREVAEMWKSDAEINQEIEDLPNIPELAGMYALRSFWGAVVFADDYRSSDDWKSALTLTKYGNATLAELGPSLVGVPDAEILQAFFIKFFHHELFIDHRKTDSLIVRQILQRELLHERIRLPHRFGRLLYDRFNDTYLDTRTDHLMPPDVQRLLQGTPVGVYQLGKMVSGPLGITDSKESRSIPPTLDLPLWHCSDTGCGALHEVEMLQPSATVLDILARIKKALFDHVGPSSEWASALSWLIHEDRFRRYVDLVPLIADCIPGRDRTTLLEMALHTPHKEMLRAILALPPRQDSDAAGPAAVIASRLSSDAQLQLLLSLSDKDLVGLIDEAVFSKAIRIPIGEIREITYTSPRHSSDSGSQLSALGLRSVEEPAVVNLVSSIRRSYQLLGLGGELDWRVRRDGTKSTYEALVTFVREHGPAQSLRELVLSSARITAAICESFQIPLEHASGTDSLTVERVLWKLGFSPMQFDDSISRLRARLSDLKQTVLASTPINTEDARERVRAAGVNVFVSFEEFTDRLVSYCIWLLASDHFLGTSMNYSSPDARHSVAKTLGESLRTGDKTVVWNRDGVNDLGTLLRYLRAAVEWVQTLVSMNRDALLRREAELPHFADDERLHFPFRHIALWADSDPNELRSYADLFSRVVKLIEESEPASVRNGLDHFREGEQFPTADKLLACVTRLDQAVELADENRLLPKVFWLYAKKEDRFGIVEFEFRDSAGHRTFSFGPPLVSVLEPPSYESACLIAPGNLLGSPNSSLIFHLTEPSEFSAYWKNYPRRRRIPGGNGGQPPSQKDKQSQTSPNDTKPGGSSGERRSRTSPR
jgi:hypothetical protein